MAVPVPPRRTDVLTGQLRWPAADTRRGGEVGGAVRLGDLDSADVLGNAAAPTTEQFDFIFGEGPMWWTPDARPNGAYFNANKWWRLVGGAFPQSFRIFFEWRSAADVAAAAGPGAPALVWAVTRLDGDPLLPDVDGEFTWGPWVGSGYEDRPQDRNFRILLNEDLIPGSGLMVGARGVAEVITHEMAHVAMTLMAELYGDDYVIETICEIFGRSTDDWNDPGAAWGNRVVEAAAETFKDFCLPNRLTDNRTNFQLDESRKADFLELFFGYVETPAWSYANGYNPFFFDEDPFFANLFAESVVRIGTGGTLLFASDEWVAANQGIAGSAGLHRPFARPSEGDDFTFHWNFNVDPYVPLQIAAPVGGGPAVPRAWSDFDPAYEAHINIAAFFYEVGTGFPTGFGDLIGSSFIEVNPADNPDGFGTYTVTFPPGLPDAFVMYVNLSGPIDGGWNYPGGHGEVVLPKGDLWSYFDGVDFINPAWGPGESGWYDSAPMDFVHPWVDWNEGVKLARWPIPDLPWPYGPGPTPPFTGTLTLGIPRQAPMRPVLRVAGGRARNTKVVVSAPPPTTVLEGAQLLGPGHDTVRLVTTLGMPAAGEIKVVSALHSIMLAYTSITSGTILHGVTYISGHVGEYPDGAHVFKR